MRRIPAKIISPALRIFIKYYFKKPRKYSYKKIKGVVLPGVFFPQFTMSTKMLMDFITPLNLENKSVLELGCGTGLVSVLAAKKGAKVFSSDINPTAIKNAELNAEKNGVKIVAIQSDLFEEIDSQIFDFIIINPPYYPKNPKNNAEKAWFCGKEFEYFEKLFLELAAYFNKQSQVLMILSEDCELTKIKAIANKNNIAFTQLAENKKWGELTSIFQLQQK